MFEDVRHRPQMSAGEEKEEDEGNLEADLRSPAGGQSAESVGGDRNKNLATG
ncbi:hypothetical protein [Caballeronia sp. NCTM1]|uniref:hypothetical protein n=1 Tax=Caballeronia sp. NCTM1 TaxID=2921753 RepID=UPI002028246D|nr:hypothetical protein [Caballeronia sp. NCTM1]